VRGRIVLLVTSPRLPAGLLTADTWDLVRANPVFAAAETNQSEALREAGAPVTITDDGVNALIGAVGDGGTAVWLAGPAGDESLARQLGLRLAREPQIADMELAYGSWDPPGARLLDAVTVMDRLSSPGGDPWKLQQTHRSLAKYMIEEVYEAYDAIDADDLAGLREELGDVLLQVVLHARLAEDAPDGRGWTIDDVAGDLVAKLVRRNPHVFGEATDLTVEEITAQWEAIKKAEKSDRGPMDGIALAQPALSLADKVMSRAAKAGIDLPAEPPPATPGDAVGATLWAVVAEAAAAGLDAEAELRRVALRHLDRARD
jgi:XTP/dITP diphosphohydrolase